MKGAAQALMDEFGVLERLIFNQAAAGNAESIARILGMVHLYRASGVHLLAFFTFLKMGVSWMGKNLGARAEHAKLLSFLVCALSVFWIWHFQNYRVTLIRPILTFIIREFFKERGARARIAVPLLMTYLSETILSKDTSFTEGALHYYLSVAGGLFAYHLKPEASSFRRHLYLAIGSWLPIAMIALIRDHEVSYFTPVYSLLTLPVISSVLYPITLVDLWLHPELSPFTVSLWNDFLKFLFWIPDQGISFAVILAPALYLALPLAILFGVFWEKIQMRRVIFAFTLFASLTLGREVTQACVPAYEAIQLDVHQGDGALFKKGDTRSEMVDVGSLKTFSPDTWLQKLALHGMTQVDAVLLTHLDEDHTGALKELLTLVPTTCVQTHEEHWRSEKGFRLLSWMRENAPLVRAQNSGCIRLLQVGWFQSKRSGASGNELMAGVVFAPNDHEAYFGLGDGDEEQELAYEHYFQDLILSHPLRIWKVGHHGSRFSSNPGFLSRMNPQEFWISAGKHNPYHHPHPLTLLKLSALSGKIYRTDELGDVSRSFKE